MRVFVVLLAALVTLLAFGVGAARAARDPGDTAIAGSLLLKATDFAVKLDVLAFPDPATLDDVTGKNASTSLCIDPTPRTVTGFAARALHDAKSNLLIISSAEVYDTAAAAAKAVRRSMSFFRCMVDEGLPFTVRTLNGTRISCASGTQLRMPSFGSDGVAAMRLGCAVGTYGKRGALNSQDWVAVRSGRAVVRLWMNEGAGLPKSALETLTRLEARRAVRTSSAARPALAGGRAHGVLDRCAGAVRDHEQRAHETRVRTQRRRDDERQAGVRVTPGDAAGA
jgi:hypothetical protein